MPFTFKRLEIPEVILITPKVFKDDRGFFLETYQKSEFERNGMRMEFVQDNHSKSQKGVLRGLHYQLRPFDQAKIVRCTKGKIFDVAVDVRRSSKTFGKWVSAILSEEEKNIFYIPSGFAHGFLTLSDEAEILYKASKEYSKDHERGIIWNDKTIGIKWPADVRPLLSEKDSVLPTFLEAEVFA